MSAIPGFSAESSLHKGSGGYGMVFTGVLARGLEPAGPVDCCNACMGPCLVNNSDSVCLSRCSQQCSTNCATTCGPCTSSQQCCGPGGCWTAPCGAGQPRPG